SLEIINRATKLPIMKDLRSFPDDQEGEMINSIREALNVARDTKDSTNGMPNNVLTLTFRGPVSDECPRILHAIIDSYTGFLNETYRNVSEKTVELIMKARDTLNGELNDKRLEYENFRKQTPVLLLRGPNGSNMYVDRLAKTENRRQELRIR